MTAANMMTTPALPRARLFSLRGRLGRARYIAYSLGALVGVCLFMFPAGYLLLLTGSLGRTLYTALSVLLFYVFLPFLFMILTVKRAHDFNFGGWVALLLLVPVVNFAFWFIPGTRGENAYGMQPEPESFGMKAIAVILPVLLIGTFLASDESAIDPSMEAPPAAQPSTSLKPYNP
ncbi:DUF805 domain-containing protein [Noviherbaspirillum cavernae]|nr:DUF805 domain-containing protein [Noviherbaspirillum cavernae]